MLRAAAPIQQLRAATPLALGATTRLGGATTGGGDCAITIGKNNDLGGGRTGQNKQAGRRQRYDHRRTFHWEGSIGVKKGRHDFSLPQRGWRASACYEQAAADFNSIRAVEGLLSESRSPRTHEATRCAGRPMFFDFWACRRETGQFPSLASHRYVLPNHRSSGSSN